MTATAFSHSTSRAAVFLFLACFVLLAACTNAINPFEKVKEVFKRRPIKFNREGDVEAQAEEILSYNSACDQQLAKAMVILGEQKTAAESALDVCRQHREVARDDIKRMENEVAVADDKIREKETEFSEQLRAAQKIADDRVFAAEEQLARKEAEMQQLVNEHTNEKSALKQAAEDRLAEKELETQKRIQEQMDKMNALEEAKNAEIKMIMEDQSNEIQKLKLEHSNSVSELKQHIETLQEEKLAEQQKAEEDISEMKRSHEKHVEDLQASYQSKLDTTDSETKRKLERTETSAKQRIDSVTAKLSSCTQELNENKLALGNLQKKHDRARQEIATWEQVFGNRKYCNFTYILEDSTHFARSVGGKVSNNLYPIYERYLKDTMDKTRHVVHNAMVKVRPVVQPFQRQMEKRAHVLMEHYKELSAAMYAKVKATFVNEVCPRTKASLKKMKRKKGLSSPPVDATVKQACNEPDEFLTVSTRALLVLFSILFRRILFRAFVSLIMLPFKILFLPFRLIAGTVSKKPKAKKSV